MLLIAFYVLSLALVIILSKPRLIIYDIFEDQLRPILDEVIHGSTPTPLGLARR